MKDPRFNNSQLDDQKKATVLTSVREACLLLELDGTVPADMTPTLSLDMEENQPPKKRLKGLAAVLSKITGECHNSPRVVMTPEQKVESEIASYLDFPVASMEIDPLQWWKKEKGRFPNLAQLAKKFLCICGTSVPSERIFSKAGYINDNLISRLNPKNVDKLIFLSVNMH